MIEWILISILVFICIMTVSYILKLHKNNRNILQVLKNVKDGDPRKLFAKGNETDAEIIYMINEIINQYENEILKYKQANENSNELLTSLSHDIRTPLASLIGYLDALIDNNIIRDNERIEYLDISRKKAYDLNKYVDLLFDWFKLNSKEMIYNFEQIEINEFTREILIDWLPIFSEKDIILFAELTEEKYFMNADRSSYKRMLDNIIQNAIVHSNCKHLKITILKTNNYIIKITNDGEGIAPDKLPFIFKRLYRCDESRQDKGNGLGLSIVKELVTAHGGRVEVDSQPGIETIFSIIFPI